MFSIREYYVVKILNVPRSVRKPYLRASYQYKIGCILVRGIALPAAQLFVIAIESILRGVCGQFNKRLFLFKKRRRPLLSCHGRSRSATRSTHE